MVKYRVEKIVLDVETLEADIRTELETLVTRFAEESETTPESIKTRMRGILSGDM